MTRREALQILSTSPAWSFAEQTNLRIHLEWKSIEVVRNGETITINPDELFAALKPQRSQEIP